MSEESVPKRRGRKPKPAVESQESDERAVQVKQAEQFKEFKGTAQDEWFEVQNSKLLKRTRYANGVYQEYLGRLKDPGVKAKVDKARKDGKLRA